MAVFFPGGGGCITMCNYDNDTSTSLLRWTQQNDPVENNDSAADTCRMSSVAKRCEALGSVGLTVDQVSPCSHVL